MYRKQVNAHSPLRILEGSIHGGLGRGNLGVVMARAGVGKTACLVQIALDDLMRERPVLHVALEQSVEHVMSWYDTLFKDIVDRTDLHDADGVHAMIQRNRVISAFADHDLWPERLEKTVEMFREHLHFEPAAILVDGYNWGAHSVTENAAMIGAFKSYAKLLDAELWMSAQTHRKGTGAHPTKLPPPCDAIADLIDVGVFLEPHGHDVLVRLLKDHDQEVLPDSRLHLHPDTMSLAAEHDTGAVRLPAPLYTLLSGGAAGAEQEFGQCAEEWGLMELTFSFSGRPVARNRGIVELSEEELAQGDVSAKYQETHMHRRYPDTEDFRRILQSIWHQVSTAGEVFCVGAIQDDQTVKGGTGWAIELGRLWGKPVHVFDQDKEKWFRWDGAWREVSEPRIRARRFAGNGTRHLKPCGEAAIRQLFERSFGPANR